MDLEIIILIIGFALIFIFVVWAFIRLPFRHKEFKEDIQSRDSVHVLSEINRNVACSKVIGKLVRKKIDEQYRTRYGRRLRPYLYDGVPKDYFFKYYLTFETFKGYKSFTVTKEEFNKYSKDTYGYIFFQKHRFSHFEVRNRDELQMDKLIKENRK